MSVQAIPASACNASSITFPFIFGTEIVHVNAAYIANFSQNVPETSRYNHGAIDVQGVDFCNITVTYTHPGQNDTITMEAWLPAKNWNRRMLGTGGGGYVAGRFSLSYAYMAGAIGEGYMTTTTDAGHSSDLSTPVEDWALLSPGNVNLYALQNFASTSLNETAFMGKSLAKSFYGEEPDYSYWSGCSQGGRQGYMLAQRYPEAYDGIAASAPAINWNEFTVGNFWPQLVMNMIDEYPRLCELDALTKAAVDACDAMDGVTDGIIGDPKACKFDPFTVVGTSINCTDGTTGLKVSKAAAVVANATWSGPRTSDGRFLWVGQNMGASLAGAYTTQADTECNGNGTCVGSPNWITTNWIKPFIYKDAHFNISNLNSLGEFEKVFKAGIQQYASIIGTNDPDLSAFRKRNGKMLTYHGLSDEIIYARGTERYYNAVMAQDPNVHDFYRVFQSPGLSHCAGGPGGYPSNLFNSLVAWVENGIIPNNQTAYLPPTENGARGQRLLCPYPQRAVYNGIGDFNAATSYSCK